MSKNQNEYLSLICNKCHNEYSLHKRTHFDRQKSNTPNYCKECLKAYNHEKNNQPVERVCDECNTTYLISKEIAYRRKKNSTPNLCKSCMRKHTNEISKNYYTNLSDEDKKIYNDKRNWHQHLSEKEKEEHAQRSRDQRASYTQEQRNEIYRKNSEGLKRHWLTVSEENKQKRINPMRKANLEYWHSMTPLERSERNRQWFTNLAPDEKAMVHLDLSERMSEYNNSLSLEEKQQRAAHMNEVNRNISDEDKIILYKKSHAWIEEMSKEERIDYFL